MENYYTIEAPTQLKSKHEVKNTILSSRAQPREKENDPMSYRKGTRRLKAQTQDNWILTQEQMSHFQLTNPFQNQSQQSTEQRSPTNIRVSNIGALHSFIQVKDTSGLTLVNNEINESLSSNRHVDESFEQEVFQASMDFNNYPDLLKQIRQSLEEEKSTPRKDRGSQETNSIHLPPSSLIAQKNPTKINKSVLHSVSESFPVPKCNSDESDIGDLDENYSVSLNHNQAYFDQKQYKRIRSRSKQKSMQGLIENTKMKQLLQDERNMADEIIGDMEKWPNNDEQELNEMQSLDCRLVYMDMKKHNKQELRLSNKQFKQVPASVLELIQKSVKEKKQQIASIDLSNNTLKEIESSVFSHLGDKGSEIIEKIKAQNNKIESVSCLLKCCVNLQVLDLNKNQMGQQIFSLVDNLTAHVAIPALQHLNLADNELRQIPPAIQKLVNLQTLNLSGNKIRSLNYQGHKCPLSKLTKMEEFMVNNNRMSDLPTCFHSWKNLRILGCDWFIYVAVPNQLAKIVDCTTDLKKLQSRCQTYEQQGILQMTFKQFGHAMMGLKEEKDYDVDAGYLFDEDSRTALHKAVLKNDQAMVTNLLKDGSNPNIKDCYDMNPLTMAFNQNHQTICKIIIKQTKKIDFSSLENSSLLLNAQDKLDLEMMKQLLKLGCDPNLAVDPKSGEYCLHSMMYKMCYSKIPQYLKSEVNEANPKSSIMSNGRELDDEQKCEKILNMLLNHGADINVMCKQKYTPFLLAVRLGNIDMVSKLLQILIAERGLMTSEDLSAKTGNGLNTALHIAAAKTNYQVIFELDKWGADIFVRNRENKTCFQVVNNNLLMLKLVKQLERKFYINLMIRPQMIKVNPIEAKVILYNNILLNSGEYKQFKDILFKMKKEFLKTPPIGTSVFNRQNKSRPPSVRRDPIIDTNMDTNGSETIPRQARHASAQRPQSSAGFKKRPSLYASFNQTKAKLQLNQQNSSKSKATEVISIFDFMSNAEKPYEKTKIQKDQFHTVNVHKPMLFSSNIKTLQQNAQDNLRGRNQSPPQPQFTSIANLFNHASTVQEHRKKDSNQDMSVLNQTVVESDQITSVRDPVTARGDHKNIYFLKDQILDQERLQQLNSNSKNQKQLTYVSQKEDDEKAKEIMTMKLPFVTTGEKAEISPPTVHIPKQLQDLKLVTQLRSIFNPLLHQHVSAMCEIVEKLFLLKGSNLMIDHIVQIAGRHLNFWRSKNDVERQKRQHASILIRKSLDNLSQNILCPQELHETVEEVLAQNPANRKPIKKVPIISRMKEKRNTVVSVGTALGNIRSTETRQEQQIRRPDESVSPLSSPNPQRQKASSFWGPKQMNPLSNRSEQKGVQLVNQIKLNIQAPRLNQESHKKISEQDISPIEGGQSKEKLTTVKKNQVSFVVAHNHKNPLTMQRDRSYTYNPNNPAFQIHMRLPVQPTQNEDAPIISLQTERQALFQHHALLKAKSSTKLAQKQNTMDQSVIPTQVVSRNETPDITRIKSNDDRCLSQTKKDITLESAAILKDCEDQKIVLNRQQINYKDARQFSQQSLSLNQSKSTLSPIKQFLTSKQQNTDNISNISFRPGNKEPALKHMSPKKEGKLGDEAFSCLGSPEEEQLLFKYQPHETNEVSNTYESVNNQQLLISPKSIIFQSEISKQEESGNEQSRQTDNNKNIHKMIEQQLKHQKVSNPVKLKLKKMKKASTIKTEVPAMQQQESLQAAIQAMNQNQSQGQILKIKIKKN